MGVLAYPAGVASFAALGYFGVFISNLSIAPKTIDHGASWFSFSSNPYCNNVLFFLIFAMHHSIVIHKKIAPFLKNLLSKKLFGDIYSISASAMLVLFCLGWTPIPQPVWSLVNFPLLSMIVSGCNVLCWVYLIYVVILSSPVQNAVFKKIEKLLFHKTPSKPGTLMTDGIYSYVRHPIMSGLLATMWIYPHMSVGHLLYCCIGTFYIFFAIKLFEEPKLVKEFGEPYVKYMKKVPGFIPGLF